MSYPEETRKLVAFKLKFNPPPARLNVWHQSPYQDLLKRGKSDGDAIFLDIGSGSENNPVIRLLDQKKKKTHIYLMIIVGNDARKLVADGYPLKQVVTSDLRQGVCTLYLCTG